MAKANRHDFPVAEAARVVRRSRSPPRSCRRCERSASRRTASAAGPPVVEGAWRGAGAAAGRSEHEPLRTAPNGHIRTLLEVNIAFSLFVLQVTLDTDIIDRRGDRYSSSITTQYRTADRGGGGKDIERDSRRCRRARDDESALVKPSSFTAGWELKRDEKCTRNG